MFAFIGEVQLAIDSLDRLVDTLEERGTLTVVEAARALFATSSIPGGLARSLLEEVTESLNRLLKTMPRGDLARESLDRYGALVLARDQAEAAQLVEAMAPEHLHVQTRDPEGFAEHEMRIERSADLRYFGQAWEVAVDLPAGKIDEQTAALAAERFHGAHEQRYGYSYRRGPGHGATDRQAMEWVNLRVTGIGPIARPRVREQPPGDGRPARALSGARSVVFSEKPVECPIYERALLAPGDTLSGPAVIEEYGATTVVYDGQRVETDRFGNLILTRGAA